VSQGDDVDDGVVASVPMTDADPDALSRVMMIPLRQADPFTADNRIRELHGTVLEAIREWHGRRSDRDLRRCTL
jgi:hypothetical protein